MKLLLLTQKVDKDDAILGFFHEWIALFSVRAEKVTVLSLSVGRYDLPKNVEVVSLGKEKGATRFERLIAFYEFVFERSGDYDTVLVHMNPIYTVLAGIFWRLAGKRLALWYTHRNVDLKLRLAVFFSHVVFTASPEGCRVRSKKVQVMGHGIAVDRFEQELRERPVGVGKGVRILHVGRITAIKNCDTIVDAVELLRERLKRPVSLAFIGAPVTSKDEEYAEELLSLVRRRGLEGMVGFTGSVRNSDLPLMYARADLTINATPSGGLDKAVIESMAAGVPVLTSNNGFRSVFGADATSLVFRLRDSEDLATKAAALLWDKDLPALCRRLHATARGKFEIHGLISRICDILQTK